MFLNSLIEELCTKEENKKAGCTLTFGGQFILESLNNDIFGIHLSKS